MCGVVGYIGDKDAKEIIINGLEKLEYRGYDSAGIALVNNNKLELAKKAGKMQELKNLLSTNDVNGNYGIGHTRWATHGDPLDNNAHPHTSQCGKFSIVHNGIIENYLELKKELLDKGYSFTSETDSEVFANLLSDIYNGDLTQTVFNAVDKLQGAYGLGIICVDEPDKIIGVRNISPLIIGRDDDGNFLSSDIPALLNYTRKVQYLNDKEIAIITKEDVKIYDFDKNEINREIVEINWDIETSEKEGYEHFMIKEVMEQPKTLSECLSRTLDNENNYKLECKLSKEELLKYNKIHIIGCGTAYYAGTIGKRVIEEFAKIPVITELSSEYKNNQKFIDEKTLAIVMSQSGETMDTLLAQRYAKEKGATIFAIVNVVGSTIAREADHIMYQRSGPELSVASTKAYTGQLMSLFLLSLDFGRTLDIVAEEKYQDYISEIRSLPSKVSDILDEIYSIKTLVEKNYKKEKVFYMGRGIDVDTAVEGALKLKELAYINCFAIAAGELKHGTLALIEKNYLCFAITTQKDVHAKMHSNIKEVKSRGGDVILITTEDNNLTEEALEVIKVPNTYDLFTPMLTIIPLQLIAYYTSAMRGLDVDKPRNLAKSVTVE